MLMADQMTEYIFCWNWKKKDKHKRLNDEADVDSIIVFMLNFCLDC